MQGMLQLFIVLLAKLQVSFHHGRDVTGIVPGGRQEITIQFLRICLMVHILT